MNTRSFRSLLVALFLLLFIAPLGAQRDTTRVPVSVEDYMDQRAGLKKLRWSRDVWWFNTQNNIDFHRENHSHMRLINVLDPAIPGCVEQARKLEAKVNQLGPVQVIHLLCAPSGRTPDTTWVMENIIRHELKLPVAVFSSEDPREVLETAQFPHAVLTFSGGRIYRRFSGFAGVAEIFPVLDDINKNSSIPLRSMGVMRSRDVVLNHQPRKLIASPTAMVYAGRQGRFYVADHQRNRVLLIDTDGQINERIGQNQAGFQDGFIHNARFNGPSGLALDSENDILYISDTHNHAIRMVNLRSRKVTTVLGTGEPALIAPAEVFGTTAAIASPTGLVLSKGKLYIAMTGLNQIWEMDLTTQRAAPIAGISQPGSIDNANPMRAQLNTPVSLCFDGNNGMYVLDRGSGNVRRYSPDDGLQTVFGNDSSDVKLFSPTSICVAGGKVFIADPHAHQVFTLEDGKLSAFAGMGDRGYKDGKKGKLGMPEGLMSALGELYISDSFYGLLRNSTTKKPKLGTFDYSSFDGILGFEQGITSGIRKDYDEFKLALGTNTITFNVRMTDGYEVRLDGRNEISLADGRETNRKQREDGWFGGQAIFEVDNQPGAGYLQFEVYTTYSPEDNRNIIYYKSMAVFIPFHEETVTETQHTITLELDADNRKDLLP